MGQEDKSQIGERLLKQFIIPNLRDAIGFEQNLLHMKMQQVTLLLLTKFLYF